MNKRTTHGFGKMEDGPGKLLFTHAGVDIYENLKGGEPGMYWFYAGKGMYFDVRYTGHHAESYPYDEQAVYAAIRAAIDSDVIGAWLREAVDATAV
jgi:hypothetical protein